MHPESFKVELKKFDKRLDFIFDQHKSCWKVIGIDKRNIQYTIYEIPLGRIDTVGPHIIQSLYDASPIKQGSAKAVNLRIDEEIRKEEESQDRHMRNVMDTVASEVHDSLMRRSKLRISNIGIPETIEIRDKRRILCQQDR